MSRFLRRRSNTGSAVSPQPVPRPVPRPVPPPQEQPVPARVPERRVLTPEQEAIQVRVEVYLSHWKQTQMIINKVLTNRRTWTKVNVDEVQTVANYFTQMMHLLVDEEAPSQGMIGRLLELTIQENMLEKLFIWSERAGDYQEDIKRELLRIYELIISQCKQSVLMHPAILNPLLRLLLACWEYAREDAELQLIPLLQQLCISLSADPNLLEFLFHASPSKGPAKFLLFSLLIPYIHREGLMGQQARDALLLCISVSAEAKHIGKYIAESTSLCPVLAGGLGALYSRLPRKLDISPDHWHCLTPEDVASIPELGMFLNSLEFCNAVVQVAHPLISDQLVHFFHDGFLVPVIGPALHQFSHSNDVHQSTSELDLNEEIVSATAYVELFLRSITDARLMRAFLHYLCIGWYDNTTILESLIRRIGTNSKLCVVTLSLFNTLLNVNCEDVMVELLLKYLVPCTHVMASQRKAIRDVDFYGRWAEKFLSLTPTCSKVQKDGSDKASSKGSKTDLSMRSRNVSDGSDSQSTTNGMLGVVRLTSKDQMFISGSNQSLNNGSVLEGDGVQRINNQDRLTPDLVSPTSRVSRNSDSDTISQNSRVSSEDSLCDIESSHIEYLLDARGAIIKCTKSCRHWSAPYDGLQPAPTVLSPDVQNSSMDDKFRFTSPGPDKNNQSVLSPTMEESSIVNVNTNERTSDDNNVSQRPSSGEITNGSHDSEKSNPLVGMLSSTINEVLAMSIDPRGAGDVDTSEVTLAEIFPDEHLQICEIVDNMDTDKSSRDDTDTSESKDDCSEGQSSQDGFESDERGVRHSAQRSFNYNNGLIRTERDILSSMSDGSQTSQSRQNSYFDADEPSIFWQFDSDLDMTPHRHHSTGGVFFDDSYEFFQSLNDSGNTHNGNLNQNGSLERGFLESSFQSNGNSSLVSPLSFDSMDEHHFTLSEADMTPQSGLSSRGSSPLHEGDSPREKGMAPKLPLPAGLKLSITSPVSFSPGGKISGGPTIGPFMATIFTKLDSMMQNSLYVNLLLTGIISRLACFPQPLLRSFLLNTTMVFQPSVRSLVQVLTSVKSRLDAYATTVDKWDVLLLRSRQYLVTREVPDGLRDRSWSVMEEREKVTVKPRSGTLTSLKQGVMRRGSFSDMFLKRRNRSVKNSEKQKLSAIREAGMTTAGAALQETSAQYELLKARNAVYCAVVLEEFVKELAALAQEHAVLSVENLE